MPEPDWREMSRSELDAAYNNSAAVADSTEIARGWAETARAFRETSNARLDMPYGERERERVDYFTAQAKNAPLFVFIHGGYWQMREKETFSHFAAGPLARGFDVAMVGYTLAPEVGLRTIVEQIRQSLNWLASNADDLGFDPTRIFAGGWSAGGHLTAMMADHPAVKGGLAISGVFDLEPIAATYLNEALQLDDDEIADLSPIRHVDPGHVPMRLCYGSSELSELQRHSADYARTARDAGLNVTLTELEGHNHFTILDELLSADGALVEELVALNQSHELPD